MQFQQVCFEEERRIARFQGVCLTDTGGQGPKHELKHQHQDPEKNKSDWNLYQQSDSMVLQ